MRITSTEWISKWKSKGLSDEITKPPSANNDSLATALSYVGNKTRVKFVESCLEQETHFCLCNNSEYIYIYIYIYCLPINLCK